MDEIASVQFDDLHVSSTASDSKEDKSAGFCSTESAYYDYDEESSDYFYHYYVYDPRKRVKLTRYVAKGRGRCAISKQKH